MDAVRLSALSASLAGTGLLDVTRAFGGALHRSVTRRTAVDLLLVGTDRYEPWHLAAHLGEEAVCAGIDGLTPVLLRHRVPERAPAHLAHGLHRLAGAGRGATVLVVAPDEPGGALLERVDDARRGGATVLALDSGDHELGALAHERLAVPVAGEGPFDLVQHLVSAAAASAPPRRGVRARLARLAEQLAAPPVLRW
ncbi:hypothetical protein [Kitasatospora sp. NPDC059571]|uniref:hypothetical protein n=1 Tax=Kitasatospora sp. NPDC059571 TaxID=3346871 RepID=UPI0036823A15